MALSELETVSPNDINHVTSPLTLDNAWEAARMAGFEEDIKAMPMGMHTLIAEAAGTIYFCH